MSSLLNEAKLLFRYCGAGIVNAVTGLGSLALFTALGCTPASANVFAFACSLGIAFVLARKFVFRARNPVGAQAFKYLMCFFLAFGVNLVVLYKMEGLGMTVFWSQVTAISSYVAVSFALNRFFVFYKPR